MFWIFLSVFVIIAALMASRRRRRSPSTETEAWRASLQDEDGAPLDLDEIRRSEEEWLADSRWNDAEEGEEWR